MSPRMPPLYKMQESEFVGQILVTESGVSVTSVKEVYCRIVGGRKLSLTKWAEYDILIHRTGKRYIKDDLGQIIAISDIPKGMLDEGELVTLKLQGSI